MTWNDVLNSVVQRSFAVAQRGDRVAEGEAMRQFDLLVKLGGFDDLVTNNDAAAPSSPAKGKA